MTPLQEQLRNGKTPEDLGKEFGLRVYRHPTLPLWGFKYDQIDSPKIHPVVRWSRGTILEEGNWRVVGQPFVRFFNQGEYEPEWKTFNWNDFNATVKEDGSLSIVYWYAGEWQMNTSGSFALGKVLEGYSYNWRELFWKTLRNNLQKKGFDPDTVFGKMDKGKTYIFELCTPFNKVVRDYEDTVFLLGAMKNDGENPVECSYKEVEEMATEMGFNRPKSFVFKSLDEILGWLAENSKKDVTFEGFVIWDGKVRAKVKSETYLAIAHLKDNGNFLNPKNMVPIILSGEIDEVYGVHFKEVMPQVLECKAKIDAEWVKLKACWNDTWKIEGQKEFALAIKGRTLFTGLLFALRKEKGNNQTEGDLWKKWNMSAELIVKMMF